MNVIREIIKDAAVGVAVADDTAGLDAFVKPGCAAAIWRRKVPDNVQAWIDTLPASQLPRGRVVLPRAAVSNAVSQLLDIAGTPPRQECDWLHADITGLAERFADLMDTTYLRLRLEAVTTNACRKFHIDAVTGRLICTYRGTGTQYGISTDGGEPRRVFTVPTGAPFLLRGTLWPEAPASGLLHRSPPIEGTGETRLVLVLDAVDQPEPEH